MARYTRTSQRRRATASGRRKTEYRERVYSPAEEDEIAWYVQIMRTGG